MNVPPLLSHIRSFSFLFRSCSFVRAFFSRFVRALVRSSDESARVLFRFVSVCAPRRVFDVFTSFFFRSSASPRGKGKKREEKGVETSKTRPRGAGRFSRPKRGLKTTTTHVREREGHGRRWKDQSPTPRAFLMKRSSTRNETKTNTRRVRLALARMTGGFRSFVRSRGWWGGGDVVCTVIHF